MKDLKLFDKKLLISSSTDKSMNDLSGLKWEYKDETNFLIVDLASKNALFKANHNYTFEVEFKAMIRDDNLGLYRSSYIDDSNQKRFFNFILFKKLK